MYIYRNARVLPKSIKYPHNWIHNTCEPLDTKENEAKSDENRFIFETYSNNRDSERAESQQTGLLWIDDYVYLCLMCYPNIPKWQSHFFFNAVYVYMLYAVFNIPNSLYVLFSLFLLNLFFFSFWNKENNVSSFMLYTPTVFNAENERKKKH